MGVPCPANSTGPSVFIGCTCNAGYTGAIAPMTTAPWYSGACNLRPCAATSSSSDTGVDGNFYCVNGGSVAGTAGSCTCTGCNAGYTGANCASDVNECASVPCQNGGTCVDGVSMFTCTCVTGWEGPTCTTQRNPCITNEDNCDPVHATCIHTGPSSHTCTCSAGYTTTNQGVNCTNIDECASNPCQNGGTCVDNVLQYTCTCPAGYSGTSCETFAACVPTSNPTNDGSDGHFYCVNGGTINGVTGSCSCTSCNPGFSGTSCQTNINECASSPCQNGAVCVDMLGSFFCNCSTAAGYSGTLCATPVTCAATQVANSNLATAGSITGTMGQAVNVTCNAGYSGGGTATCSAAGFFNALTCSPTCSTTTYHKRSTTCPDFVSGLITTEAECRQAQTLLGLTFASVAGPAWHSGCLFHGGSVYFSPHTPGSTQNPTDAYICRTSPSNQMGVTATHCGAGQGQVASRTSCTTTALALGLLTGTATASVTGGDWQPGCLFHNNGVYYSPGKTYVQQTATCTAATLIGTADECQNIASAQLNLQWRGVAGSDWQTGCLFHNGGVYFSPFQAGSTNNPSNGYICSGPPSSNPASSQGYICDGCV
jgi:hypothetical protein